MTAAVLSSHIHASNNPATAIGAQSSDDLILRVMAQELTFKRALKIISGFVLMGAGVAGWLLPFIPGWALFIPGLILLSREFHWARRLLRWLRSHLRKRSAPQREDRLSE